MEIRKGIDEETGHSCYAFINTLDSDYLLTSGAYTPKQMEYFKLMVSQISLLDGLLAR